MGKFGAPKRTGHFKACIPEHDIILYEDKSHNMIIRLTQSYARLLNYDVYPDEIVVTDSDLMAIKYHTRLRGTTCISI
tara:strand:+ start:1614 stop:1847 length:234 start_codon:yes stop_codon:yes gene_type:complete